MTRGRCGLLALFRRALSSPSPCRFIPAHHPAWESISLRDPARVAALRVAAFAGPGHGRPVHPSSSWRRGTRGNIPHTNRATITALRTESRDRRSCRPSSSPLSAARFFRINEAPDQPCGRAVVRLVRSSLLTTRRLASRIAGSHRRAASHLTLAGCSTRRPVRPPLATTRCVSSEVGSDSTSMTLYICPSIF